MCLFSLPRLFLLLAVVGLTACDTEVSDAPSESSGNLAPVADAGTDFQVDAGASVTLNGSGADSDGTITSFLWLQTSGTEVTLSDAAVAKPNFLAPDVTTQETLIFKLVVTDDLNASHTDSVNVLVTPSQNIAPVANAGLDQRVVSSEIVTLLGQGSDSDGSVVSYLWQQTSGTPVGLSDSTLARPTFRAPAATSQETLTFKLTVSDNRGSEHSDTVAIIVSPKPSANIAPTANAGTDQQVTENETVTLLGSGTDSDGTITSYLWQQTSGSSVILSDSTVAQPTFQSPLVTSQETLIFKLTVTDNQSASHSDSVSILVSPLSSSNVAPVANAGADQQVTASEVVTLLGSGTDSDGNIVSYLWQQTSGTLVGLSDSELVPNQLFGLRQSPQRKHLFLS